jgi:imidazolonepropionase-like amidohydrolase
MRILGLAVVLAVLVGLAGLALRSALLPPAPLALPARGALLQNVTVVNPGAGRRSGQTLRVDGERIAAIEPADRGAGGAFDGAYVLPGLIDMHVHFPPPSGLRLSEQWAFLFLYHGVTTVRDAGDVDGTATEPARRGIADGDFPGPRIFACGFFVDGEQPLWKNSLVVTDAASAEAAVARVAEAGYDCVKTYDHLTPEALAAVRRAAAEHGLPVIGHVPRQVPYAEAQLDDVQHLTGVGVKVGDMRPFPAPLEGWPGLRPSDEEAVARTAAEQGFANTPTLVTRERLVHMRDYPALREEADAQLLPRLYRDAIWNPATGPPYLRAMDDTAYRNVAASLAGAMRIVKHLQEEGAAIHLGTDTLAPFVVPGASAHRELALLVEAGLTPEEAWVAGTRAPGAFLGAPGLGTVAPSAPADLLVFREDPTRDLAALATLEAVVADGRLYPREALDAELARYRAYQEGRLFDTVSVWVTQRMLARVVGEPQR